MSEGKIDTLWNKDIARVKSDSKSWSMFHIMGFWASMSVTIPSYMIGALLISSGMTWWQATGVVAIGGFIIWILLILLGGIGVRYGISFPVLLRVSFGTTGARFAALIRAGVACGWCGMLTWIGSKAIASILLLSFPSMAHFSQLGFSHISFLQLACFLFFLLCQSLIVQHGMEVVKKLEMFSAPILMILILILLWWFIDKAGSLHIVLQTSYRLNKTGQVHFWEHFWPGLAAVISSWIAVALNVSDFTRFIKRQKDQIIGQFFGFVPISTLYALIGILLTSATAVLYGSPIWDPSNLAGKFHSTQAKLLINITIVISALCTNVGANIVAAANDFANFIPKMISFKRGVYIACLIGLCTFPWRMFSGVDVYVFRWLLLYPPLIGALSGIVVSDYYLVRRRRLLVEDLYVQGGIYNYTKGWHIKAFLVLFLAILPIVPGLLGQFNMKISVFSMGFVSLYKYGWLISFFLALVLYWLSCRIPKSKQTVF